MWAEGAQAVAESIEMLLVWTGVKANAGDLADLLRARRARPCDGTADAMWPRANRIGRTTTATHFRL
jgi:hypothetical protein